MALTDKLSDIGNAIRARTGGDSFLKLGEMPAAILGISGGASKAGDVNFYDYDGTLLDTRTVDEAARLTSLPVPPAHEGLEFRGWNYSLEIIRSCGRALNIGAIYTTASRKSELDICLTAVTGTGIQLCVYNEGGTLSVDWGDGEIKAFTAVGGNVLRHDYATTGNYTISLDSEGGYYPYAPDTSLNMFNASPNYTCVAARFGGRCTGIGDYAFRACYSLARVVIPSGMTRIGSYTFNRCNVLTGAILPNGVTTLGTNAFFTCRKMAAVALPDSVTSIGNNAFYACHFLHGIVLPRNVTSIGGGAFSDCSGLNKYVMLCPAPPTLSSISAFNEINALSRIEVPKGSLDAYRSATNWAAFADYMEESSV